MPDEAQLCSCNNVSVGLYVQLFLTNREFKPCHDIASLKDFTWVGTRCGSCVSLMKTILDRELEKSGLEVSHALCEHVSLSRVELFEAIYILGLTSVSQIVERFVIAEVPEKYQLYTKITGA